MAMTAWSAKVFKKLDLSLGKGRTSVRRMLDHSNGNSLCCSNGVQLRMVA